MRPRGGAFCVNLLASCRLFLFFSSLRLADDHRQSSREIGSGRGLPLIWTLLAGGS